MNNFNKVVELTNTLTEQVKAYEHRTTKAESKRIRATLGEIKKLITGARADLVEADKG